MEQNKNIGAPQAPIANNQAAPQPQAQPQPQPPQMPQQPAGGIEDDGLIEQFQTVILERVKRLEPGDMYALADGFKSEEAIGVLAAIVPEISPILAQILQFMSQEGGEEIPEQGAGPEPEQQKQSDNPIVNNEIPSGVSANLVR